MLTADHEEALLSGMLASLPGVPTHPACAEGLRRRRRCPCAAVSCPADLEPIPEEDPEIDFTPQWELQHLCENGVKYRLFGEDPATVPACAGGAAWLSTTMRAGCYSVSPRPGGPQLRRFLRCCHAVSLPGLRAQRSPPRKGCGAHLLSLSAPYAPSTLPSHPAE